MRTLNIKDYTLQDWGKITSEFISDIVKNFLDNFLYLFEGHKDLINKYNDYKLVSTETHNFLYNLYAAEPTTGTTITAYTQPYTSLPYSAPVNVNNDTTFGIVSLETFAGTGVNLLPKLNPHVNSDISDIDENNSGVYYALTSTQIAKYVDGILTEDINLRKIIDDTGQIWYEEDGPDEMELVLTCPTDSNKISYLAIYPYGGTIIESISFGTVGGEPTVVNISDDHLYIDGFPIKVYVNKIDFNGTINIILKSTVDNFYSIGYIEAYAEEYSLVGTISYDLGQIDTINTIDLFKPNIYPDIYHRTEEGYPISIKITQKTNELNIGYDSEEDGLPWLDDWSSIVLPVAGSDWIITFTLKPINGASPMFRKCVIT